MRWQEVSAALERRRKALVRGCAALLADRRRRLVALGGIVLPLAALLLFLVLREGGERGERFPVPEDEGELTAQTTVHPQSPLHPAVQAFRDGSPSRAAQLLDDLLAMELSTRERAKAATWLGNLQLALGRPARAAEAFRSALRADGKSAAAHHGLGRVAQLAGENAEAERWYRQALACDARWYRAMHRLGEMAALRRDTAAAADWYGRALAIREVPLVRAALGDVLREGGDLAGATRAYRSVLDVAVRKPLLGYAAARLGDLAARAGKQREAVERYRQAVGWHPEKTEFRFNLAVLLMREGDAAEALRLLQGLLDRAGAAERPRLARILGGLSYAGGELSAALRYLSQAGDGANDPELLVLLADLAYRLHRHDEALLWYRALLDEFPRSPLAALAWVNTGNIHALRQQYEEALKAFEEALLADPRCVPAWHNRGVTLRRLERPALAAEAFRQAFANDPTAAPSIIEAGRALAAAGRPGEALRLLAEAVRSVPRSDARLANEAGRQALALREPAAAVRYFDLALSVPADAAEHERALRGLARVRLLEGRHADATAALARALSLGQKNALTHYYAALAGIAGGRPRDAEQALRAALLCKPAAALEAEIRFRLGLLLFRSGERREAYAEFRRAVELDPSHAEAAYNAAWSERLLREGAR